MIKKFTKIIFLIFLFQSCERKGELDNGQDQTINYYEFLNEKNQLRFYIEKKTNFKKGLRIDSTFVIKEDKKELEKIDIFRQNKEELYYLDSKNKEFLLFLRKRDTTLLLDYHGYQIRTQYLGYQDIEINKNKYKKISKFKKEDLGIDGVVTYIYFDDNFNMIREEYVEGYQFYFRIDKIEKKPEFFESSNVP
jgi:hypothetical protein